VEKAGLYRQNRNWQIFKKPILNPSRLGIKNRDIYTFFMLLRNNFNIQFRDKNASYFIFLVDIKEY
tara:strand:+ start:283 stop:480 length:198 start_codon:yes stop_codon:yes gene_type:complete